MKRNKLLIKLNLSQKCLNREQAVAAAKMNVRFARSHVVMEKPLFQATAATFFMKFA